MEYFIHIDPGDDVLTVDEFVQLCGEDLLTDDDGCGYPAKDGMMSSTLVIWPSRVYKIPSDATHIVWFNK